LKWISLVTSTKSGTIGQLCQAGVQLKAHVTFSITFLTRGEHQLEQLLE